MRTNPSLTPTMRSNARRMPDSGPARALIAGRADLHLHSIFYDGLKTPEELCGMARRLGLRCLALTDHDTVSGLARMAQAASAQCAEGGPLCFIPGVEVSAGQGGRVHVLGYGADARNAPLVDFLHKSEADRREQAQKMLALLEGEGIRLSPQAREALDRPAVGRALVKEGAAPTVKHAFDRYLGEGRPAYVPRPLLPTGEAVARLRSMGLVPVLAHPMRMGLEDAALYALVKELKARGLMVIEAFHPSAGRRRAQALAQMALSEGLLVTGGSDYHGDADTQARMGRLPSGWHSMEQDIQTLLNAIERTQSR